MLGLRLGLNHPGAGGGMNLIFSGGLMLNGHQLVLNGTHLTLNS